MTATAAPMRQMVLGNYATRVLDTAGTHSPIVLIHALAMDHRMWGELIRPLSERHRVIAYDVRGHGIAAGAPGPYSVAQFAADLAHLLETLGISQAHICGISLGGTIAQQFAIDYADALLSLALVATFSKPIAAFAQRGPAALRDGMTKLVAPTLVRWFTPEALANNGAGVEYARSMLLATQPQDYAACCTALSEWSSYAQLPGIKTPTKIIAGELDPAFPPSSMHSDIAARIPGARLIVISGAAHLIALEKGVELAHALLDQEPV